MESVKDDIITLLNIMYCFRSNRINFLRGGGFSQIADLTNYRTITARVEVFTRFGVKTEVGHV